MGKKQNNVRAFNKHICACGLKGEFQVERLRYWKDPRKIYGLWKRNHKLNRWNLICHSPDLEELELVFIFHSGI